MDNGNYNFLNNLYFGKKILKKSMLLYFSGEIKPNNGSDIFHFNHQLQFIQSDGQFVLTSASKKLMNFLQNILHSSDMQIKFNSLNDFSKNRYIV